MVNTAKVTVRTARDAGHQVGTVGKAETRHAILFNAERSEIEALCNGKPATPARKAKLADALCGNCGRKLAAQVAAAPTEAAPDGQAAEAKPKRRRAAKKAEAAPVAVEQPEAEPEALFPAQETAEAEQPAEPAAEAAPVTPDALRSVYYRAENPGVDITRERILEMLPDVMDLEYDTDGDPAEHVWGQLAELVNTAGEPGADKSGKPMDPDNLPAEYDPENLPTVVLTGVSDPDPESTDTPLRARSRPMSRATAAFRPWWIW